jgi:hypothetical protein
MLKLPFANVYYVDGVLVDSGTKLDFTRIREALDALGRVCVCVCVCVCAYVLCMMVVVIFARTYSYTHTYIYYSGRTQLS